MLNDEFIDELDWVVMVKKSNLWLMSCYGEIKIFLYEARVPRLIIDNNICNKIKDFDKGTQLWLYDYNYLTSDKNKFKLFCKYKCF